MTETSTIRMALIGYGAWGAHHANAITTTENCRLQAVCVRSPERQALAKAAHPGVRVYADYRDLLSQEELDAVDVVLPSHLHFEVAREVLSSGRHLLLEKPMALEIHDCETLVALAAARGLVLAIGHELRLSSLWGKVRQLIDDGRIGEPLYALVELWRKPYRPGADGWRYDLSRVGNWILEEPIHFFDLARWYFASIGEPTSVFAAANGRRAEAPGLQDNFSAILQFPRGRYAVITQSLSGWEHHQSVKLTGTEGALWARWSGAMDRTLTPQFGLQCSIAAQDIEARGFEEVAIAKPSGELFELIAQLGAFVSAVRTGDQPPCTGVDGLWSTRMCLKAHESIVQGHEIEF